jgi:sec-independent protein translocase protein TatB
MFNVGIGEILVILLVCLIVFGPERLPEMARKAGRLIGRFTLMAQGALDQINEEAKLKDVNLPDLRVGSLRAQARDYLQELMDIDGQMAELQSERERVRAALDGVRERVPFDHEAT